MAAANGGGICARNIVCLCGGYFIGSVMWRIILYWRIRSSSITMILLLA